MNNTNLKVSPIPYVYKWGKDSVIEFWVKYSPKKPDATAGFLGMMKEKLVGVSVDPMPTVICEEVDRQVRPLITANKWMYFTVVK
jgi:hypothetical protein